MYLCIYVSMYVYVCNVCMYARALFCGICGNLPALSAASDVPSSAAISGIFRTCPLLVQALLSCPIFRPFRIQGHQLSSVEVLAAKQRAARVVLAKQSLKELKCAVNLRAQS